MIPIPDHPIGERFCRKCALFLPLANFFKGKRRRYECKAHSRGRPRKAPAKKQRLPSSEKKSKTSPQRSKAVAQVWHAAYTDCRSSFGQATVGLSQGELRELFEATGVAEPSTAFRLVPVDPCRALERGNARMAALDERGGPDEGAVVEGPGLAMSVDEAVIGRQQHDDGEAEKEELDDDDDDDDGEDDDDYNDDEAETEAATEAATAVAMKTTTATATGTAHGDVGV